MIICYWKQHQTLILSTLLLLFYLWLILNTTRIFEGFGWLIYITPKPVFLTKEFQDIKVGVYDHRDNWKSGIAFDWVRLVSTTELEQAKSKWFHSSNEDQNSVWMRIKSRLSTMVTTLSNLTLNSSWRELCTFAINKRIQSLALYILTYTGARINCFENAEIYRLSKEPVQIQMVNPFQNLLILSW